MKFKIEIQSYKLVQINIMPPLDALYMMPDQGCVVRPPEPPRADWCLLLWRKACGSGGTTAGLALGVRLSGWNARVHGYGAAPESPHPLPWHVLDDSMPSPPPPSEAPGPQVCATARATSTTTSAGCWRAWARRQKRWAPLPRSWSEWCGRGAALRARPPCSLLCLTPHWLRCLGQVNAKGVGYAISTEEELQVMKQVRRGLRPASGVPLPAAAQEHEAGRCAYNVHIAPKIYGPQIWMKH